PAVDEHRSETIGKAVVEQAVQAAEGLRGAANDAGCGPQLHGGEIQPRRDGVRGVFEVDPFAHGGEAPQHAGRSGTTVIADLERPHAPFLRALLRSGTASRASRSAMLRGGSSRKSGWSRPWRPRAASRRASVANELRPRVSTSLTASAETPARSASISRVRFAASLCPERRSPTQRPTSSGCRREMSPAIGILMAITSQYQTLQVLLYRLSGPRPPERFTLAH